VREAERWLRAEALTPAARAWLGETLTARVLSAHERALNLINQDRAVLALVTSERGLTPFAVVVAGGEPGPFRGLTQQSPVRISPDTLSIGLLRIDMSAAALWDPRPDWPGLRAALQASGAWRPRLAGMALKAERAGSLLDLYRPVGGAQGGDAVARALLARARPAAQNVAAGLAAHDALQAAEGARALAGLGGGLTPAGDDFVVGALLAAWLGEYGPGAEALGGAMADAVAPRTTTLSAAYVRAAAGGECIAQWHALLNALGGGDWTAVEAAVGRLVAIGHTSGADSLAGFLAGHFFVAADGTRRA
jgi:hypothetical protein